VPYATSIDLALFGAPRAALDSTSSEEQEQQLAAASALADSYLRLNYTVPIPAPLPQALVEAVCRIAAYNLLSVRGYAPEIETNYRERYEDAMRWLRDVGAGKASLPMDADGTGNEGGPFVVQPSVDPNDGTTTPATPSSRGW
jgi:phage gp36-like protein